MCNYIILYIILPVCSVISDSLQHHGVSPNRLLCPSNFIVKITAVGCISYSKGSSWPRGWTHISCVNRQILYHWATWEAHTLYWVGQQVCWWSCYRKTWITFWPTQYFSPGELLYQNTLLLSYQNIWFCSSLESTT